MRVLFVGDIYGDAGLDMFLEHLPHIKVEYKPNVIVVNAENAAKGRGITEKIYKALMMAGVHMVTLGNWAWGNNELFGFIEDANIVRPFNYRVAPGKGYKIVNYNGQTLLVINALGRTFMNANLVDPFTGIEKILLEHHADYTLVDFHAEATSEKVALGHYLDGKATAVVGTHTHVPTADNRVLPKGTLYMTDVGMTGPLEGIIGVDREIVINRFLNGFSVPNKVAEGPRQLNAVIMDFKLKTIERIHLESE